MKEAKKGLTRRDFLKMTAGLGVLAMVDLPKMAKAEIPENPSILVGGWDGADYRVIINNQGLCPTLEANYLVRLDCCGATVTKPGWAELESGFEYDVTKVRTNEDYRDMLLENHLFYKLAQVKPYYYQACIWSKMNLVDQPGYPFYSLGQWARGPDGMDYYVCPTTISFEIEETEMHLDAALDSYVPPGLIWCHYSRPDYNGHMTGPNSQEYKNKLTKLDTKLAAAIQRMQPDIWFAVSDHGFSFPNTPLPSDDEKRHLDAPDGFLASNLPLKENCVRRDFAFTLRQLLGVPLTGKRLDTTTAYLRGKSILA